MKALEIGHKVLNVTGIPRIAPEMVHDISIWISKYAEKVNGVLDFIKQSTYVEGEDKLAFTVGRDLVFKNPIGLAAGLIKEPVGLKFWEAFGFGSMTIGAVVGNPQPGNRKKRLFRFFDGAVNAMGFPSVGVDEVVKMLTKREKEGLKVNIPIGINLGSSIWLNSIIDSGERLQAIIAEYKEIMRKTYKYVDYFEVNISCPNQKGTTELDSDLDIILEALTQYNDTLHKEIGGKKRKLFVKIAPLTQNKDDPEDLTQIRLEGIIRTCNKYADDGVHGVIATNTAREHSHKKKVKIKTAGGEVVSGGASGRQIQKISLVTVKKIAKILDKRMSLIGVGGIGCDNIGEEGKSVINMKDGGADLFQILTSFTDNIMTPYLLKKVLLKNNIK